MSEDTKYVRVPITQASAGKVSIAAATPGQRHRLVALIGSLTAGGTVQLLSGTGSNYLSGPMDSGAGAIFGIRSTQDCPVAISTAGEALQIETTGGGFNGVAVIYTAGA